LENDSLLPTGEGRRSAWESLTNDQLRDLLIEKCLTAEQENVVISILEMRTSAEDSAQDEADFDRMAEGYFKWLRDFVQPQCELLAPDSDFSGSRSQPRFGRGGRFGDTPS
jgi:hypothetical protein